MIYGYTLNGEYAEIAELGADYLWLDVISPTREEEVNIKKCYGIDIPTREEMAEIELSNRLYEEDGVYYLTAVAVLHADTDEPKTEAVTFMYNGENFISLRYSDFGFVKQFVGRLPKSRPQTVTQVFNGLIESAINRIADILEKIASNLDASSRTIFRDKTSKGRYENALGAVGINGDLISKSRESLISFQRVLTFANNIGEKGDKAHIDLMLRDIIALTMHADFLSNKAIFLLDATLGMINFEQNNIIKIFTLAALIFLPPTLIAGIYGMNFHSMPELSWHYGYPFALGVMLCSAFIPYRYFKKRGWM